MSIHNKYSDLKVFGEITTDGLVISGAYSLPQADGSANQILVTNGSGALSFKDISELALTDLSIIDGVGLSWTTISPGVVQGTVSLAPFTTDNLSQGANNLYYQNEYVDDRVNDLIVEGTGITKAYNDGLNTLTLGVTLAPFSTTNLSEGTRLYYTDERVEDRMAAVLYKGERGTGPDAITWTHVDGLDRIFPTVSLTPFTTDDLAEGTTNKYLTENSLYDLLDQIILDSASVTWTRNNATNRLTPAAAGSTLQVQQDGSVVGSRAKINFITTPTVSYSLSDDPISGRVSIQIEATQDLGSVLGYGQNTVGNLLFYTDGSDSWTPGDSTSAINSAQDNVFITKEWFLDNDPAVIIEGFGLGSSVRKGGQNSALGDYSTNVGGESNMASGNYSAALVGICNVVSSEGSIIGGGGYNTISGEGVPVDISQVSAGPFAGAQDGTYVVATTTSGLGSGTKLVLVINSNQVDFTLPLARGFGYEVGDTLTVDGADIGGSSGVDDVVYQINSVFGGASSIMGGFENSISGGISSVFAGTANSIKGHFNYIGGGNCNRIIGYLSDSDQSSSESVIVGGFANLLAGGNHFIGGGIENSISGVGASVIGGGDTNSIIIPDNLLTDFSFSTIGGGVNNSITGGYSVISGGSNHLASGLYSTIIGGDQNVAGGCFSVLAGQCNEVDQDSAYSAILGGSNNLISGAVGSAILGGSSNILSHNNSFIAGESITSVSCNTFHVNCLNLHSTPPNSHCNTSFLVRESNGMIGYRAFGGLFAQTANSSTVTNTTSETTIIDGGSGTLTVPGGGFIAGDAFHAKMAGVISSNNGVTLTIKVKSGATVLATTGAVTLPKLTTQSWNLDIQFIVRTTGASGSLHASGWFAYNSGSSLVGTNFNTTTSPFDTTVSQTLDITVTWGAASTGNSIYSTDFTLHKIF